MAGGRPTKFTPKLALDICRAVSTSTVGLNKLCELHKEWPAKQTINEWRLDNREFSVQYSEAKRIQSDLYVEECVDIGDETDSENVQVAKLRVDTRKWVASRLLPKVYGEKKDLEVKVDANTKMIDEMTTAIKKNIEDLNRLKEKDF